MGHDSLNYSLNNEFPIPSKRLSLRKRDSKMHRKGGRGLENDDEPYRPHHEPKVNEDLILNQIKDIKIEKGDILQLASKSTPRPNSIQTRGNGSQPKTRHQLQSSQMS